jgi:hypothetical protein
MNRISRKLIILFLLFGPIAIAQRQTPRGVVVDSNRQELDSLLLRKPILTGEDKTARQAVLKQINDDFKALQVLNNKAMTQVTGEAGIDYKSVAGLITEISSKASRLKQNLALPKAEASKEESSDAQTETEFRERMMLFDKVVVSFTVNPIFQQKGVVDVELATKASKDLATIIERSAKLKKLALKLAKSGRAD